MNLTNYERETIINFNETEPTASVYVFNKPMRRRLERLAAEHPKECILHRLSRDGQAAEYYIPKGWIRINPPRKSAPLTDEQKRQRREQLGALRTK